MEKDKQVFAYQIPDLPKPKKLTKKQLKEVNLILTQMFKEAING